MLWNTFLVTVCAVLWNTFLVTVCAVLWKTFLVTVCAGLWNTFLVTVCAVLWNTFFPLFLYKNKDRCQECDAGKLKDKNWSIFMPWHVGEWTQGTVYS
jgi:hypothetical protein